MFDKVEDFVKNFSWNWFKLLIFIPLIFGVFNANNIISVLGITLRRAGFAAIEQFQPFAEDATKVITGGKDGDIKKDDFYLPKEKEEGQ